MILATNDDVKDRLRRPLTEDELEDIAALLEEASVLVGGYLTRRGITYTEQDEIPRDVVICVSRIAARALTASTDVVEGTDRLGMGPYQAQLSDPYSRSVYLGKGDLKWLAAIVPSAGSIGLRSDRGGFECGDDA